MEYDGRLMFLPPQWLQANEINLHSVASKVAGAFVYGKQWFVIQYPPEWQELNIAFLEYYPIVVGIDIFQAKLANHRILMVTDNMAVAHVVRSQTTKHQGMLKLLRIMVGICMRANMCVSAEYIKSKDNVVPDYLFRYLQVPEDRLSSFGLCREPVVVPERWLPGIYRPDFRQ